MASNPYVPPQSTDTEPPLRECSRCHWKGRRLVPRKWLRAVIVWGAVMAVGLPLALNGGMEWIQEQPSWMVSLVTIALGVAGSVLFARMDGCPGCRGPLGTVGS